MPSDITLCRDGGNYCDITIRVFIPQGEGTFPVAIFSNGFSQSASDYESYGERLASWGYIAVLWDMREGALGSPTQNSRGLMAAELSTWAFTQNTVSSSVLYKKINTSLGVVQAGHSLGGKCALQAATADPKVVGYVLLDPVDCPPPMPPGIPYSEDNPNIIARINNTKAIGAFVGAELGDIGELIPCAPIACNYQRYYNNASAPAWEVTVTETGHAQFLDDARSGGRGGCGSGPQETDVVHYISNTVLIAWAERTVYGKDISYWTSTWINDVISQGNAFSRMK